MDKSNLITQLESCLANMPLPLITMKEHPEQRGALIYAGEKPVIADMFSSWVDKALWMLENSAVAARNLPTGKFVALAYKDGYVVISSDIADSLSEEMRRACTVATYGDFGLERQSTCLVFTHIPFEISVIESENDCKVFLTGNPKADVVVYSPERLRQIVVQ